MATTQEGTTDTWPRLPLPFGVGNNLVMPIAFAQSSMFCAQFFRRNTERTNYVYPATLASMNPYAIRQTEGCSLDQGDADVFLELVRRAFTNAIRTKGASWVAFQPNEFLMALGRTPGGKTRTLLDESLCRLCDAAFSISMSEGEVRHFRLILDTERINSFSSQRSCFAKLDIRLAQIFHPSEWALLRKHERGQLVHDPLARGLHALYSSRTSIYKMKLEKLQGLLGRAEMQDSKFRIALDAALERVKRVTGWHICEWQKEGKDMGKVFVERQKKSPRQSRLTNSSHEDSMSKNCDDDDEI